MSDGTNILGADLEALLREAAADPRSQLLRVPRPKSVQGLLERQAVLRPSATELSVLDRHLLAAHRAELAELLMRACSAQLFSDDAARLQVNRSRSATEDFQVESPAEVVERATAFKLLEPTVPDSPDALKLVLELASHRGGSARTSITQLARAAQRLQPSSRADAWIAFDLALHGQPEIAIRLLGQIMRASPVGDTAPSSLENLGLAYANTGQPDKAARAYRQAFEWDSGRVSALVGWMHYAIKSLDSSGARDAGRILDDVARSPRESLLQLLNNYELQKRTGDLVVSRGARSLARTLSPDAGALSGKVIDVYL